MKIWGILKFYKKFHDQGSDFRPIQNRPGAQPILLSCQKSHTNKTGQMKGEAPSGTIHRARRAVQSSIFDSRIKNQKIARLVLLFETPPRGEEGVLRVNTTDM